MTKHSFIDLGEQLTASLIKASEDNVIEAMDLRDKVKTLTEDISAKIDEHTKLLNEMDTRLRSFGQSVLDAHKKFLNGQIHENPTP